MTSSKTPFRQTGLAAAGAAVLSAGALSADPAIAQAQAAMAAAPTTRILAVGHMTPKFTPDALKTVLPAEVRDTVRLYLAGKIGDWYARKDKPGVVFVLNTADPKEALELLDALPFGRAGMMEFDLIPLGPLVPLGVLLNGAGG
jgi:hypothetical protein